MFYCFLTQRYKRDYLLYIKVKTDLKHPSPDATHLSHKFDKHLKVSYNTPHFTAVITALHLNNKWECAAVHITLKRSTTTLKIIRCFEWALSYITTASTKYVCQLEVSCLTHHFSAICSSDCESCLLEWANTPHSKNTIWSKSSSKVILITHSFTAQ